MAGRGGGEGAGGEGKAVDDAAGAGDELELGSGVVGIDQHRAKIVRKSHLAPGDGWIAEAGIDIFSAAESVYEIGNVADAEALEVVLVAGEDGISAPLLEGPLHVLGRAMGGAGGKRRLVEIDDLPACCGSGQGVAQPLTLDRILGRGCFIHITQIGLVRIGVEGEELDRALGEGVIALIAGQCEIIEVGLGVGLHPLVIAQCREEMIHAIGAACAEGSFVGGDEIVVVLADVGVDGAGCAELIVVVADGEDQVGVPGFDAVGDVAFGSGVCAKVANYGEAHIAGEELALLEQLDKAIGWGGSAGEF
jgi:hypothetical protein